MLCGDVHSCPGPGAADSQYSDFKKRGMHFIHFNVRSLLPKIDQIRLIAKETNCACLCLSETWLDNSVFNSEISIDNYTICRKDRNHLCNNLHPEQHCIQRQRRPRSCGT